MRLFKPSEISKLLRIRHETVLDHIHKGILVAHKIGKQYRITEESLRAYAGDKLIDTLEGIHDKRRNIE